MADVDSAVGLVSAINVATGEGLGVTAFVSGVGEVGGLRSAELAGAVVTLNLKDGSKIYLNPSALSAVKLDTKAD